MSTRTIIYFVVVGALALVTLLIPALVIVGMMVLVVPGLLLAVTPSLFAYSAIGYATFRSTGQGHWLIGAVAAAAVLAIVACAIPSIYNAPTNRLVEELVSSDMALKDAPISGAPSPF